MPTQTTVTTADGREIETWASAGTGDTALLLIHGTPHCGLPSGAETAAAEAVGVRLVSFSRAGYGTSSRLRGRVVADAADDVRAIAEALDLRRLHVVGHSGGGPHALACAALLPGLVASAATIAGVAPWGAEGLDWLAGMAEENIEEFGAALAGESALAAALAPWHLHLAAVTADEVSEALGGLVSDVDRACLTGAYAELTATRFRHALQGGVGGWIDDDLAFTRDWGFALAQIACPVTVWQGDQDMMVPSAHGAWLAHNVPGAAARLLPGEGHLSLALGRFAEIVADVVACSA